MPAMWCIKCQAEREHAYFFGQEPCCEGGNCEHQCRTCGMNTLAYIQSSPNHSEIEVIKQMVGEAQRIAQRTGRTGDIEVVKDISSCGNNYQAQVLVYNTYSGSYRVSKR